MQWEDSAIIIKKYDHSDSLAILSCLTNHYGLQKGAIKLNKKNKSNINIGNIAIITWQGRLAEHLGTLSFKSQETIYPFIYNDRKKLVALQSISELMSVCLAEKEPQKELYQDLETLIYKIKYNEQDWLLSMALLEINLLAKLGFGFDPKKCAVTQSKDNLFYLSPKTGKAVSKKIGEPYADKLFKLPRFFIDVEEMPELEEIINALKISRYFFKKNLMKMKNIKLPNIRNILEQIL